MVFPPVRRGLLPVCGQAAPRRRGVRILPSGGCRPALLAGSQLVADLRSAGVLSRAVFGAGDSGERAVSGEGRLGGGLALLPHRGATVLGTGPRDDGDCRRGGVARQALLLAGSAAGAFGRFLCLEHPLGEHPDLRALAVAALVL